MLDIARSWTYELSLLFVIVNVCWVWTSGTNEFIRLDLRFVFDHAPSISYLQNVKHFIVVSHVVFSLLIFAAQRRARAPDLRLVLRAIFAMCGCANLPLDCRLSA